MGRSSLGPRFVGATPRLAGGVIQVIVVASLCFAGCDEQNLLVSGAPDDGLANLPPPEDQGESVSPSAGPPDPELSMLPSPSAAYPNDASTRRECLAACSSPERSEDDQATCRLACGPDSSPEASAVRRFVECRRGCVGSKEEVACVVDCQGQMSASFLPDQSTASGCTDPCFETLDPCLRECGFGDSADQRSTCRLHCEDTAARCLEDCGYTAN